MGGGYDRLTPEGKRFYAELKKLHEQEVFIGYQSGEVTDDNGVDMAQIAMFNELGTSDTPSRPFLRMSVDDNQDKINSMCKSLAGEIAGGGTAEQTLKKLGAFGVSLVQEKIGNGTFVPNAPSTIKKKGSDKPLIDTGKMRQSVKYVIRKKGGD